MTDQLPVWIQWATLLSVLIAGLALIGQSITFFVDRFDREKDLKRGRIDEYWFRQILLPVCIDPLLQLAHDTVAEIGGLHQIDAGDSDIPKHLQRAMSRFAVKKMAIVNSALILTMYRDELYDSFSNGLDKLQDGVEEHISLLGQGIGKEANSNRIVQDETYIQQFIWSTIRDVIQNVMKHHDNV